MNFKIYGVVLVLQFLGLGSGDLVAQTIMQREADKADPVKRIMSSRTFKLGPTATKQRRAFCESFLTDFRSQQNVQFVEPVAKAISYDDPVWSRYKARCGNDVIFERFECEPKIAEYLKALPDEERRQRVKTDCRQYRGTANFKLYVVDLNRNPKDGKEHVFYFERAEGPLNRSDAKSTYSNGGYTVVDLDRCEATAVMNSNDPYSYLHKRHLNNFNGVIRYRSNHYIFNLFDLDGIDRDSRAPHYSLQLIRYSDGNAKNQRKTETVCSFSTIGK